MAQQVILARTIFTSLDARVDNPSFATHWEQVGSDESANLTTIKNRITGFLNTLQGASTAAACFYLSKVLSRGTNASTIEYYDITGHLDGTPHGSPIQIDNFTLGAAAPGVKSLPEQAALCVGYRVDYGTDVEFLGPHLGGTRPRARDRNRFYLGPLADNVLADDLTTNKQQWTATFVTNMTLQIQYLLELTSGGPSDITTPVVWSRKAAAVKQPITQAWIENEAHVERRRVDPGVKTLMAV